MIARKLDHPIDIKRPSWLATGCLFGSAVFGILLSGCASVGPGLQQPALPMLTSNYQVRDSQLQSTVDLDSWWQSFSDPTLDQLVSRSLANNLTVQVAVERIVEARANLNMKGRKLCRHVDSNWELDLFGRIESTQQTAQANLLAKEFSLQDVQQTLVADVATSYLNIRLVQTQIEIVEQSLQLQQKTTTLVSGRASAGVVTKLDAEQTVAFLHRSRANKAALELELDTELNRLAILLGESPTFSLRNLVGVGSIPEAPYLPAAGIPTDLIRRRPDIRQAEAEVGAATALTGIAKADVYPRLRLSGFLSPLGGPSPLAGNPLNFRRGNDNVEIQESRSRQAINNYRVAVLAAVKEVEDSMAMYDGYRKQLAELEIALQADARAVELSLQRYEMGKANFQRVIDVQVRMLEDSQASAEARAKANIQLIKLYKAVGGGWPGQAAAGFCGGCAECATGHQQGCSEGCSSVEPSLQHAGFQNDAHPMNQGYTIQAEPSLQLQDGGYGNTGGFESDVMLPSSLQMISPPQPGHNSILQTDDFGPGDFTPNFGQSSQNPNGSASNAVLAEMFDWDEKDAAVVKSFPQNQSPSSPIATAGYFADAPRVDNKQKTQKASSIRSTSVVWDSEAVKVD